MGGSHEATPVSQPITKGGSGQFGGKGPGGGVGNTGSGFGGGRVTFDAKGNRLVDGKIQEGKGGTKIFAGTANENAYLAERGLSNKGTVFDKGLFAKSDIAKEQQTKESVQTSSLFSSGEQAGKNQQVNLSESFVFSDKVKPQKSADVVLQPYEKSAFFQPKANAPTTGGIETPQSKALGSTYSWENLGKESGVIFFTRDSKQEQQAKKSEESRASTIFASTAKPEPKTDTTYGGPSTKESAGQAFGTGDRLIRDSPFEKNVKTKEAERATQTFNAKSQEKTAFFSTTPANKPSSAINIDPLTGLPTGNTKAEKQARENYAFGLKQSTPQTATPFQDVSGKGSTKTEWSLDIGEGIGFSDRIGGGSRIASTSLSSGSSTKWSLDISEGLGFGEGISGRGRLSKEETEKIKASQKENALFLASQEYPGNTFVIKDQSGKVISTTSGQRSRYDFMKAQGYGSKSKDLGPYRNDLSIAPKYNGTFAEGFKAASEAKAEPKSFGGILSDIGKGAESYVAQGIGLGYSALGFASKGLGIVNENGHYLLKVTDKESFAKSQQDINYGITSGYKVGSLLKGRIEQKEPPPLTHKGETIMQAYPPPTASRGFVSVGGTIFGGMMAGAMFEGGARGLAHATGTGFFKTTLEFKIPIEKGFNKSPVANLQESKSKITPYYQGVKIFNKPAFGKTPSGYVFGKPKPETAIPESSIPVAGAERGREIYTPSDLEQSMTIKNPAFFKTLESRNVLALGPKEARASELEYYLTHEFQSGKVPQKTTEVPAISSASPEVNTSINKSLSKMQGPLNIFNPFRGRTSAKYGSGVTYNFLSDALRGLVRPADIDVHASQPLGIFEEKKATNMAKFTQKNIQKDLGIAEQKGVSFHATTDKSAAGIISSGIDFSASKRGEAFFTMNTIEGLQRFGGRITKVNYEPNEVIEYKKLPKDTQKKLKSNDWLTFQENVIRFAQNKNKKAYSDYLVSTNKKIPSEIPHAGGITKPYGKTKYGALTDPNAKRNEIIFLNEKPIKSVEVLPKDLQMTTQEGRRIFGEQTNKAEGGKIEEFITSRDVGKGSSINKTGKVAGIAIDTTKYKQILPTGEKITTVSGKAQEAGNLSKIALQDIESAKAQNASPEQLAFFEGGKKVLINSEAFAGKAVSRNYLQHYDFAMDLLKNPSTKEKGQAIYNANEELLSIRGSYHGITKEDIFAGKYNEPETPAEKQSMRETFSTISSSGKINYGNLRKGIGSILITTSKPSLSSKSQYSVFSESVSSGKSGLVGKSGLSSLSNKSGTSSKSGISGKSTKSSLSSLSGKSSSSGKSSPSGKSGISSFSSVSSSSLISGPSGSSTPSSSSIFSGSSSSSSRSSSSIFSGFSSITTHNKILKPLLHGDLPRKRKVKSKYGPTALYKFDVTNPFASGLNITIARNKKFEF